MKKSLTPIICLISLIANSQAFDLSQMAHSPNASTLGQFGEIPVSQFTGVPQIQIPIYEFTIDGHKFPINISYHTSGIRLEQKPSWVGAGWNLTAGGSIMRKQNGRPDELRDQNADYDIMFQGYFYNKDYLNSANWGSQTFINNYLTSHPGKSLAEQDDVDADEFMFNFMGYSGSFFMDHTGTWQIKCDKCVHIDSMKLDDVSFTLPPSIQNLHTKVIKGFVIIADDGVRYRFGYNDNAIDFTIPFSKQHDSYWTSTAWYLTDIVYPSGTHIHLNYTRGHFTSQLWYDLSVRGGQYSDGAYSFCSHEPNSKYDVGTLISPTYLTSITFPLGQINFCSSDRTQLEHESRANNQSDPEKFYYLLNGLHGEYHWPPSKAPIQSRSLDSIIVKNNQNERIQKAKFIYNYGTNIKLGLNVLELYGNSSVAQRYTFGYYKRDKLPTAYNTQKTDHWGYFRGTAWTTQTSLLSAREPVDSLAGYGVLNKITYPTGGYTRFEYESHKCNYVLNDNKTAVYYNHRTVGGCRIKRIINSSTGLSSDEIVAKEYFYASGYRNSSPPGYSNSGVLAGLPQYEVNGYVLTCPKKSNLTCTINMFSMMHSVFSGGVNSMGSHIGYSEVAERYPNGSYRIYKFSNYDNGYLDNPATAVYDGTQRKFVKYSSLEQTRGLLLELDEYNAQDSLMKSTQYTYSMDTTKYIRGFYINVLDYVIKNSNYYPILEACTYKHYLGLPKLVKTDERVYSNGVSSHRFHKYHYNKIGQISRVVENDNQGDSIETLYTYIWEMPGFNSSDFLRSPIYTIERNIHRPLGNYWLDWDFHANIYMRKGSNLYVPTKIYNSYFVNNNCSRDSTICDYDSNGHLIFQAQHNGTDPVVYLWHNSGQYIVGIIKNASLDKVMNILNCNKDDLGCMPANSESLMGTLREQLPKSLVTSFQYKPLVGMISETSPSGITKYYEYDNNGRLAGIKNNQGEYIEFYKYNIAH